MNSIITIEQLSREDVNAILTLAQQYKAQDAKEQNTRNNSLERYNIGLMFFEPSTRTLSSFQTAINKCKGTYITYTPHTSSSKKGEALYDTIKTMSCYCNLLVIRHPSSEVMKEISSYCDIPLINAGDGAEEHPSQALLDLFTIQEYFDINVAEKNIKSILFVGDLKYSRTICSLIKLLKKFYPTLKYYFLPVGNLVLDNALSEHLDFTYITSYDECIASVDVVYMTRLQVERFQDKENFAYNDLILTPQHMAQMKKSSIVMHPLPRNDELSRACDYDTRSVYFEQVKNGVYVRMALLNYCLNK